MIVPITGSAAVPTPMAVAMLPAVAMPAPAALVAIFVSVTAVLGVGYAEQAFALDAPVAVV
jgi:hypothetical protein